MNKVSAIVIARCGSSRLPNKVLADIAGSNALSMIVGSLKKSSYVSDITIATSHLDVDNPICGLAKTLGVRLYRGDPEDVLSRLYGASLNVDSELILEVGGDCPLVDAALIEFGMNEFERSKADFVSNAFFPPFTFPVGYDFCLIQKKALCLLNNLALLKSERYQPFQYVVRNPDKFTISHFTMEPSLSSWRLTLDYQEDLDFFRTIFRYIDVSNFTFEDIRLLLNDSPEIIKINSCHAENINISTAWYTGSYVKELTEDLIEMLLKAAEYSKQKDYDASIKCYLNAGKFIDELHSRSKFMIENKNNA